MGGIFHKTDRTEEGAPPGGYIKVMSKEWDPAEVKIGRPAPVTITDEMVAGMKAGSITVDLAAEDKGLGAGGASCDFTDDMGRGRREGGGRIN
eukprot:CAMPEP_0194308800 /NCGR_PEP_ID=MMETSP0171-20130528/5759_1 /TAXON_ID=218684 /ORGANISM="Corethron pennatum, Strain L29A3" /LENGTH=92 /DNA_ID=CAMNT_0039061615 /DNA_START=188 /DNA_END=467 /DNA_ORIENTATION=+